MKGKKGFQKGHKINNGKVVSEETRKKISKANTGKKRTPEVCEKYRLIRLNYRASDETKEKLRIIAKRAGFGGWNIGRKMPQETKDKISKSQKGRNTWMKGRKTPIEVKEKISASMKKRVELGMCKAYKGGITPLNTKIRESLEYRLWRESVFKRDNWTCVLCGFHGYVEADHIKSFSEYPELRFELSNGRTLCKPCHRKTDNYGRKKQKKDAEQQALNHY